jgi:hypothetical protein
MTEEEIVFNAIDDFIQLQVQGQAPSPEEYVKGYPEALKADLLNALHHIPFTGVFKTRFSKHYFLFLNSKI